ncbi:uncharacterized protein LOC113510484 isoform X2 [Galleria mellonella]|uniref:Uncharacterized protein LOC113510484 isoform X2 n=1 Tax=Galleria mellonella TaxID=7137 RepID=A0A6J1W9M4_GALME|nr:uncharacterized protein LOC113510484 isoform X2 [Galleria mellonella]
MDVTEILLITIYVRIALSKKYILSSDESFENMIYYKDCNHKHATEAPPAHRDAEHTPPPRPQCLFPKMCCSMSCENECVSNSQQKSFMSRQMEPLQDLLPPMQPVPPQLQPVQPQIQRGRKKKVMQPKMQPPIGGRRDFGFTKERIKSLISQDEDIRKILKDLVRVTMQKVDLLEMYNARRNANIKNEKSNYSDEEYED